MFKFRAGPRAGRRAVPSRAALAAIALGLPLLAQAQFSGISQSGSAAINATEYYSYSGGQATIKSVASKPLANLSDGSQIVSASLDNVPLQASLSTSVSTEEIRAEVNVKASTGFRVIYNSRNLPDQNVASDGSSTGTAAFLFTVGQGTAIAVTGSNFYGRLEQLNDAGLVTRSFVGLAAYDLNWLDAGAYKLSIGASASSKLGPYGMGVISAGDSWNSWISVKVSSVPEPSTLALWALGGVLLTAQARRRRH